MTTEVTISLPNEVYHRAESLAKRTGRSVSDVLAQMIDVSMRPFGSPEECGRPIATWSDAEVVTAACAMMPDAEDHRLSDLLYRQQAGVLTDGERPELLRLMQLYQEGLVRKAEAIQEGVRRNLMERPKP
jgi:predicted CopG family antitoxin